MDPMTDAANVPSALDRHIERWAELEPVEPMKGGCRGHRGHARTADVVEQRDERCKVDVAEAAQVSATKLMNELTICCGAAAANGDQPLAVNACTRRTTTR